MTRSTQLDANAREKATTTKKKDPIGFGDVQGDVMKLAMALRT